MENQFTDFDLEQMKLFVQEFSNEETFEENVEKNLIRIKQTPKFVAAYYCGILDLPRIADENQNQTVIGYKEQLVKVVNYLESKVEEPVEVNNEFLQHMTEAPNSQLDKTMTDHIKTLIGKSAEEVKIGLKYVLDASAWGSLASDLVMEILDHEWRRLGGTLSDKRTFYA
jgi:hypothetical protein